MLNNAYCTSVKKKPLTKCNIQGHPSSPENDEHDAMKNTVK